MITLSPKVALDRRESYLKSVVYPVLLALLAPCCHTKYDNYLRGLSPVSVHKLIPALVYKIWGGRKLAKLKGVPATKESEPGSLLGETWEVSIHPDGPSKLQDGSLLSEHCSSSELPYLVKFIESLENLSIQVHPGDEYAKKNEGQKGKSECWFILEHEPGAGIYLGLKEGVTKETLEKAIKEKKDISLLLNFYPVSKGKFFFVPHGSIHAIGRGVSLAEIQQSSGVTYRVWDWNRVDDQGRSRELHLSKALDVINFDPQKNEESFFKSSSSDNALIKHRDFEVFYYETDEAIKFSQSRGFIRSIINLEGELSVEEDGEVALLTPYDVAVVTDKKNIHLTPRGNVSKFLIVS